MYATAFPTKLAKLVCKIGIVTVGWALTWEWVLVQDNNYSSHTVLRNTCMHSDTTVPDTL